MTTEEKAQPSTEEFVGRLFDAALKGTELVSIYLGDRLGLYRALHTGGPATAPDFARRVGVDARHVREWLEQQAVAGMLAVDDVSLDPDRRLFTLPPEHAEALVDPESPASIMPVIAGAVIVAQKVERLVEAMRSGDGLGWDDYGSETVDMQGDFNRPWLVGQLAQEILPSIADVHATLSGAAPRVLDVACGVGWSSIAIAKGYPRASVYGVEPSAVSVERARGFAAERGVSDRVTFAKMDARRLPATADFDMAIIIEAVHDMSDPVGVLSAIRGALKPGASLLVADERVGEAFTAPSDEIERLMYAYSVLMCLPNGMAEKPTAATGTVMRPATLKRYASEAGFQNFEVLDIDLPTLRFYRLR